MAASLDLKKAVHVKGGGGMDPRQVKHGVATAAAPTTTPSPKKVTKKGA